jgi:hypothetical protein
LRIVGLEFPERFPMSSLWRVGWQLEGLKVRRCCWNVSSALATDCFLLDLSYYWLFSHHLFFRHRRQTRMKKANETLDPYEERGRTIVAGDIFLARSSSSVSLALAHVTGTTMSNLTYLFQRSYASSCLDLVKMREFVPSQVKDEVTGYKGKITEMVFDPLKIQEVNAKFDAAGYIIPEDFSVIGVTADKKILIWGGVNSVYYLKKGEELDESLEENMAFNDIVDLTTRFKIKNKKTELDDLIAQLKKVYSK